MGENVVNGFETWTEGGTALRGLGAGKGADGFHQGYALTPTEDAAAKAAATGTRAQFRAALPQGARAWFDELPSDAHRQGVQDAKRLL